jgi:hypothetical protein
MSSTVSASVGASSRPLSSVAWPDVDELDLGLTARPAVRDSKKKRKAVRTWGQHEYGTLVIDVKLTTTLSYFTLDFDSTSKQFNQFYRMDRRRGPGSGVSAVALPPTLLEPTLADKQPQP